MFQNEHTRRSRGWSDWLKSSVSLGMALTLAGYICMQNPALAAFNWPSVSRGETDETSARVTMIQCLLRSRGYSVVIDGHYGSQTQHVVRRFQVSHGLRANGTVGARTWRQLIVTLKPGSHGDAVRAIQVPLKDVSDVNLSINGRFDLRTERAVRMFQGNNGLTVDGIVGRATWLHLTENITD